MKNRGGVIVALIVFSTLISNLLFSQSSHWTNKPFVQFVNESGNKVLLYSKDRFIKELDVEEKWSAKVNTGYEFKVVRPESNHDYSTYIVSEDILQKFLIKSEIDVTSLHPKKMNPLRDESEKFKILFDKI